MTRIGPASIVLLAAGIAACGPRQETVRGGATAADVERARTLEGVARLPPCDPLPQPRPEWERVDAGPFSLQLPREYRKQEVHGIDSFVGRYRAPGRELGFDYGVYSGALEEWRGEGREFHACRDSVSPHLVRFVTARSADGGYLAGAAWRQLERGGALGDLHLTIHAQTRTAAQQQEALAVFRSLQFDRLQWPEP